MWHVIQDGSAVQSAYPEPSRSLPPATSEISSNLTFASYRSGEPPPNFPIKIEEIPSRENRFMLDW